MSQAGNGGEGRPREAEKRANQPDNSYIGGARIQVAAAKLILGVAGRTVQKMAQNGELPGAALIGRLWTFDEAKLRQYVRNKERERWHGKHPKDVIGVKASF